MAIENLNFAASVNEWVRESEARMLAVFRQSAQDVVEEMQKVGPSVAATKAAIRDHKGVGPVAATGAGGHMPVDTGFLRASLRVTRAAPTPLDNKTEAKAGLVYDAGSVALTIGEAALGDTLYATYTAAYARRINYGFVGEDSLGRSYNQRGYHFVELAAQKWQQIVTANVGQLEALAKGAK